MLVIFTLIVFKTVIPKEELSYIEDVLEFEEIETNDRGQRTFTKCCSSFSLPIDSEFKGLNSKSKIIAYVVFPQQET